jgi:urocanate hydratase
MHAEEAQRLAEKFNNAISAGEIQSPVTLHWQTADGAKQSIAL